MQELKKNSYKIEIGGKFSNGDIEGATDYTTNVPFPIKWAQLLDEQLDEGSLTLLNTKVEIFPQWSPVKITLTCGEEKQEYFFVISADNSEELPVGSKKYKHTISVIEETKWLERFIVRSHAYVNKLEQRQSRITPFFGSTSGYVTNITTLKIGDGDIDMVTPQQAGNIKLPYPEKIIKNFIDENGRNLTNYACSVRIGRKIDDNNPYIYKREYDPAVNDVFNSYIEIPEEYKDFEAEGVIIVEYFYSVFVKSNDITPCNFYLRYYMGIKKNKEALPKWNAKTVVERALTVAEVLQDTQDPRFKLDKEQAKILEKIETPEFHFTQSTLREVLQAIGNYIHAEPRLRGGTIYYDFYGSNEFNEVELKNYASINSTQNIEQSATQLVSTVDNLVNSLDENMGIREQVKTLRTEKLYSRIEDGTAIVSTQFPIYAIQKVIVYYGENGNEWADITSFVYEETDYSRMASYRTLESYSDYPNYKGFSLYYTQGSNNIRGLWFKPDAATTNAFDSYSIVAIIGMSNSRVDSFAINYPLLAFEVTYIPIYSATVLQSKQYLDDNIVPSSLSYNQGQNLIETCYYGENLKGTIARMGNIDKVITYIRYGLPKLPKVGTIYNDENDDYYVSTVTAEVNAYTTKVMVGLSRDFNRLSEHIGINSQKRFYEISERQSMESHIMYRDYVVIGDSNDGIIGGQLFTMPLWIATLTGKVRINGDHIDIDNGRLRVNALVAQGLMGDDENKVELSNKIILPVLTTAMGNSAVFTAKYEDNYSAGQQVIWKKDGNVTGFFANGTEYKDSYGNIDYLSLAYYDKLDDNKDARLFYPAYVDNADTSLGFYAGGEVFGTNDSIHSLVNQDRPLKVLIGSTEIPTINYQIDYVTNRRNLIIGSALAKNTVFIKGITGRSAKLYLLPTRINKYDTKIDLTTAVSCEGVMDDLIIETNIVDFPDVQYCGSDTMQAWVVVDENNELLFGQNRVIHAGETDVLDKLVIYAKHNYFN